jgi:hypothetical protein
MTHWFVLLAKLKLTSITIIIFLLCGSIFAKEPNSLPHNEMGYCLSLSNGSVRDDLLIPLVFSGPKIMIGTDFKHNYDRFLLDNSFDISVLLLTNRFTHKTGGLKLNLSSSLLYPFSDGKIMAGPMFTGQINDFLSSWDFSRLYWLTSYSLGACLKCEKPLTDKSSIDLKLQVPIFGIVSRPPEYRFIQQEALKHFTYYFPHKDFNFSSLNKWQSIYISTGWQKKLKKSHIEIQLQYHYEKYSKPKSIYMEDYGLFFKQSWGF